MSNVDGNVVLTKKKKKKRRKRNQSMISSQPAVSPVNTIAALFKLQQKLSNKNVSDHLSSRFFQDKPLMSGPRFRPNLKWTNPALTYVTKSGPRFRQPQSTLQQKKNDLPNIHEDSNTTINSQSSEAGPSQVITISEKTRKPQKPKFQTNKMSNPKINQNYKFHDCEIYDSPSFINFESDEGVTDLNDDDICNKNLGMSIGSDKININKPDVQISFETKLQQQHAKKLESRNLVNIKSKQNEEITEDTKKSSSAPSLDHKTANQELIEALSSDINTLVRDKVKTIPRDENKHPFNKQQIHQTESRYLAGVPKVFMTNSSMGAIQPRGYVTMANRPTTFQMPKDKLMLMKTENPISPQVYSPTDVYTEMQDSPDPENQKRLSAFQRLGPIEHKKSRLTINLSLNKEHTVRDVVEETEKHKPTYEKEHIIDSKDTTVVAYLPQWPWKQAVMTKKTVTARNSKTVMIMEKEYMEEIYDKDTAFILVSLEGYPENWTKEEVLDLILENLKGKHFIPCFIEFTPKECKFFVIRCKGALSSIHTLGFIIQKDKIEVKITISQTLLTLKQINFMPRIVLRSRLALSYDSEAKLDLSEFTLKDDISHFIYFPLHRVVNQTELTHLQSTVSWHFLTELNLSRNKLKSIEGFYLEKTTPRLKILDLSYNCLESVLKLMTCRQLHLIKLTLEGNPLCNDYIESEHYIKVLKTMFSSLRELDGVEIVNASIPKTIKNYCPEHSRDIVEKFLEVFFPLLECVQEERKVIQSMYDENALMTVTYKSQLRYNTSNKLVLNLLIKSRILLDGDFDSIQGRSNIVKLIKKWPHIQHDASTFTVDVVYSTDTSIIFTINGIFKITSETLAQNETLLSFTRTITLFSENGLEYKILNEMVYFDEPYVEWERKAFQMVMVHCEDLDSNYTVLLFHTEVGWLSKGNMLARLYELKEEIPKKTLGLKLESPLENEMKERLVHIFMKITNVDKKQCESYLVEKNWNLKDALELFTKVVKSSNIETI